MENPLNRGAKTLLESLEREHAAAQKAIKGKSPTAAQLRYELLMNVMVELCKEVESLRARVMGLEPEEAPKPPPSKTSRPRKRLSPGMGGKR